MRTVLKISSWISLFMLILSSLSLGLYSLQTYFITQGTVQGSEFGMLITLGALHSRMGLVLSTAVLWGLSNYASKKSTA